MKAWRVMFNDLKRGTGVQEDKILVHRTAKGILKQCRKDYPEVNFFIQEYEEARVGVNVLGKDST